MSRINAVGQRMNFDIAADVFAAYGYPVDVTKLTQNTIRSEVLMSTSSNTLHLPILVNDTENGQAFSTERRLKLTDVALVTDILLRCANPTGPNDGLFAHYSYANPVVFSTANAASSILGAYSNGNLQLLINNQQTVPNIDMWRFYKAPDTQQGSVLGYATSTNSTVDSYDGAEGGSWPMAPFWVLSGNDNIDLKIVLPAGMTAVQSANARWVAIMRVILAQNASKMAS